MRIVFDAMSRHAMEDGGRTAVSDANGTLSRVELLGRVAALAEELMPMPRMIGLLAPNGIDWAVAQLACALAGKVTVPLPAFFSPGQLGHIVRDASVGVILVTPATWPAAAGSGVVTHLIGARMTAPEVTGFVDGFGQVIYTSGSTGQPKGVRHESGQLAWSVVALAEAGAASAQDRFLSVLPLPLLLETLCAVFLPQLVGGHSHFDAAVADAVGRGQAVGLADAFEAHRPTASVVVPQLLKAWVGELLQSGRHAPPGLRFVAAGGAPMPPRIAAEAWRLGIPVHKGYGLSECCSVVTLNRPGYRAVGTSGRPLSGLQVTIEDGEIVVDGPSVTDGYLRQEPAGRPWRTGDLGQLDADGFLTVHGRKDDLIVSSFGRNISPEWIETMILDDSRIALCAVVGHGEPHLTAVLVPSPHGAGWFAVASEAEVRRLVAERCADAPGYAMPRVVVVCSPDEAYRAQLLTGNGRFIRKRLPAFLQASSLPVATPVSCFTTQS